MASEGSDAAIIQTADELLKKKDWKGLVRYLEREAGSTRNHELLWRALRAHYRCSKSGVPPGEEAQGVAEAGMRYYETVQSIPEKHQLCEKVCVFVCCVCVHVCVCMRVQLTIHLLYYYLVSTKNCNQQALLAWKNSFVSCCFFVCLCKLFQFVCRHS